MMDSHPYADLFPMMQPEPYAALVECIRAHGLDEPICICQGRIADGRNRYRACLAAGVEPRFWEWEGDEDGLLDYVLRRNIVRRDLTASQRAAVIIEAEAMRSAQVVGTVTLAGCASGPQRLEIPNPW